MFIGNACKDNRTLKCQNYDTTIINIVLGFKKSGLNVLIKKQNKNRKVNSFSSTSYIPELNFTSSGKGTTKKQALASALAELVERFSANLHFKYIPINTY